MKIIPYGISNFKQLINENMYYIDKTKYIEMLEKKDRYQFFIRPRRFGKSLLLTMLQTYYDINEKNNFDKYFGELYIGKNKTELANSYIVIKMSFANVITNQGRDEIINSFDDIVSSEVNKCLRSYPGTFKGITLPKEKHKAKYAEETKAKYGDSSAYKESEKRTSKYTKEDWAVITEKQNEIYKRLAELMDKEPIDKEVQKSVGQWRQFITDYFYTCTPEIFRGLGELYVNDEGFTANIDKIKPGLAKFLSEGIKIYCDNLK